MTSGKPDSPASQAAMLLQLLPPVALLAALVKQPLALHALAPVQCTTRKTTELKLQGMQHSTSFCMCPCPSWPGGGAEARMQ